ncbi:MAG: membrane protein insertase YidC [Kangiellaceae bacterium]|jgi:YidC/Oxa1 family membrane protein insertase|nr:membrane protein insertase YidC [Kangiellaceae bacterium]
MESSRGFLVLVLAFITFMLYQQWQTDYSVKPESTSSQVSSLNGQPISAIDDAPSTQTDIPSIAPATVSSVAESQNIVIDNDLLSIEVNTQGGDIVSAKLKSFNINLNDESEKVALLISNDERTFVAKSGVLGTKTPDSLAKRATYQVTNQSSENGKHILELSWTNDTGVVFNKIFTLTDGRYDVAVDYKINNTSSSDQSYQVFNQFNRDRFVQQTGSGFGVQAYTGAAYSSSESRYEKYDFEDMDDANLSVSTQAGWIAYLQHYFLAAWIPNQNTQNQLSTLVVNGLSIIRVIQSPITVPALTEKTIESVLYLGPKDPEVLESLADGLDLTVDYGIFWWIGKPIYAALSFFQSFVVNWGLAIILVTISVKALLYPLASAQYRSFGKMRMLQPKLQQLKDRYGDDRQKMSMAMMELYKKEKVNPMGGCLPLLIQMPVFFALYWVLLESYEIRHAPLALWIEDLSAADPLFILPILMGASMWAMQKLQPTAATMDPMQQKIMQYLPVMMTVFFVFFPSGLVLYWLINNVLSIAQQLYITSKIEKEYAAKKHS